MIRKLINPVVGCVFFLNGASPAEVAVLENKYEWLALIDSVDTIDFTGFPPGTLITKQYADRGILFTDHHDFADIGKSVYPNDGRGLYGGLAEGLCQVHIDFRGDQFWFAVEYPGFLQVRLYQGDELLFASPVLGGQHPGNFMGLVSDEPFDRVHVDDRWNGSVLIDDLHFGPPVCLADVDGDGFVAFDDLLAVIAAWGNDGGREDLDANGIVDFDDLLAVLDAWGPCDE